ncbi:MAG: S1C family serine protease [Filomicrobium sp.]
MTQHDFAATIFSLPRLSRWLASPKAKRIDQKCTYDHLEFPFEIQRPVSDFCRKNQPRGKLGTRELLAQNKYYRHILANYRMPSLPRNQDRHGIDTASRLAFGLTYDESNRSSASRKFGLARGQGVQVTSSRLSSIPEYSIILEVDNKPIRGGAKQLQGILASKPIGSEFKVCGLRHASLDGKSTWKQEFTATIKSGEPVVKLQTKPRRPGPSPAERAKNRRERARAKEQEQLAWLSGRWKAQFHCPDTQGTVYLDLSGKSARLLEGSMSVVANDGSKLTGKVRGRLKSKTDRFTLAWYGNPVGVRRLPKPYSGLLRLKGRKKVIWLTYTQKCAKDGGIHITAARY